MGGGRSLLEHGPPTIETDPLRVWNWSVFPYPGFWRGHIVKKGGRERSKDEAKATAEAAYRRICEIPGARDDNLKHSRMLMQMRAAGRLRTEAGRAVDLLPRVEEKADEPDLDDDDDNTFHGAFDPPRS